MPYAEMVELAAAGLRRAWGTPVELRLVDVVVDYAGGAAVVLRAEVDDPPAEGPRTVIVKRSNVSEGVEMEWVGLAFLGELTATRRLVPRLLASDAAARLIVMSDLAGRGVQLIGDLLFSRESAAAEDALVAAQVALGRLNAAGVTEQHRYEQILVQRPGAQASRHAVNRLDDMLAALPRILAERLPSTTRHLDAEIRAARSCLFEPGPFSTITHGDPTVGNLFYLPTHGVKFVDLETVGYRHALLDGSFARLRYLHSVWAHHIPVDLQKRLVGIYRTELAKGCPQAGEDLAFGQALVAAGAAWLAALCSHLDRVAERDVRWGRATYRQRITAALTHFIAIADEYGHMPALRDAADHLQRQLGTVWPTTDRQLPTYPALITG